MEWPCTQRQKCFMTTMHWWIMQTIQLNRSSPTHGPVVTWGTTNLWKKYLFTFWPRRSQGAVWSHVTLRCGKTEKKLIFFSFTLTKSLEPMQPPALTSQFSESQSSVVIMVLYDDSQSVGKYLEVCSSAGLFLIIYHNNLDALVWKCRQSRKMYAQ